MDPTQQLLNQLQSSETSLGAKHKLLNQFLKDEKIQPAAANEILNWKEEKTSSFFLKKLRLDLIISLQRMDLLIDLLTSEERTLTSVALKKGRISWIFEKEISPFLNPTFLVNDFFPKVSYICRCKIINQLAKYVTDELKSQQLFEGLLDAYGLKFALRLLPKCSESFIKSILERYELPANTIRQIAEKYPQIGFKHLANIYQNVKRRQAYYSISNVHHIENSHNQTLIILARKDPKQFLDLYEACHKFVPGCQFGIRLSSRIVRNYLERVIKSPAVYLNLLDNRVIARMSPESLVRFIVPLMPVRVTDLNSIPDEYYQTRSYILCEKLKNYLQFNVGTRGKIFMEVLEKAYPGKSLFKDHLECFDIDIVSYLGPEERLRIAEHHLHLPECTDTSRWIAVKPISNSIPELKQLLFTGSDAGERGKLLTQLLSTCVINDDKNTMLEVLKFIIGRYRNERIDVLGQILREMDEKYNLLKMETECWDAINEILQICFLSSEVSRVFWQINPVLHKSFVHAVELNLPLQPIFAKIIQFGKYGFETDILKKFDMNIQRKFLESAAEYYCIKYSLDSSDSYDEEERKSLALRIIGIFKDWNGRHRRYKLSLKSFPALSKYITELITLRQDRLDDSEIYDVFNILRCDPNWAKPFLYGAFVKTSPFEQILNYYIRQDPIVISATIDSIVSFVLKTKRDNSFKKFLLTLKFHCYKDIYAKFVEKSLSMLEDKEISPYERSQAFRVLSLYESSTSYITMIQKHAPKQSIINVGEENASYDLELKEYAIRFLINIEQPSLGFGILKLFCVGDYLKYSRSSLYSLCKHSLTKTSLEFASLLLDSPVSLKKHAIRICYSLTPGLSAKLFFLDRLWKSETNVSIRQVVLKFALEVFLSGPRESSSTVMINSYNFLVDTIIPSLTFRDTTAISDLIGSTGQIISQLSSLPDLQSKFVKDLFSKIFVNQKHLPKQETLQKQSVLKAILIQDIGENYFELSDQLLLELIQKYFFPTTQHGVESEFVTWVGRILILKTLESARIIPEIMSTMEHNINVFNSSDAVSKDFKKEMQSSFRQFFKTICAESFEQDPENPNEHSQKYIILLQNLSQVFLKDIPNSFEEEFWIQMTIICHTCQDRLIDVGKGIYDLLSAYLEKYGNVILVIFIEILRTFLENCKKDDDLIEVQLTQGLIFPQLNDAPTPIYIPVKIVALQLFPSECPPGFDKTTYDKISKLLLKSNCDIDTIYINHWRN